LLVLGWPESPALRPKLPQGVGVTGQHFTIDDKLYSDTNDVLFLVIDNHGSQRVAGYLLPGSIDAARDAARRIPHYGRYSVLVFQNGKNQVKSTWTPARSPLTFLFDEGSAL
jgi:hypothetical protein